MRQAPAARKGLSGAGDADIWVDGLDRIDDGARRAGAGRSAGET
jgi:hypothetical protein